jgi:hydroxyproline transport system permease protein
MFDYTFQWGAALRALPDLLDGAVVTFNTAALSMIFGVLIALVLAVMRETKNSVLNGIANAWVSVARNTPALFQIYLMYFGVGAFGIHVGSWAALLIGITFNNAGYLAENFRGGLKAVPETQRFAARSLGMTAYQTYSLIVVPQMLRVVFYPITNQMVWAVLMTSLGVIVGLNNDITGIAQEYNVRTYRTFEFFALAAVLYYLTAKAIVIVARLMSYRLFRY